MLEKNILAIDCDGTLFTHEYPNINCNKDIGSVKVMHRFMKEGWRIILNTMRSGPELDEAIAWCVSRGIIIYGANENPTQKEWTNSPKVYAHLYIDDAAACTPLIREDSGRAYVDWIKMEAWLESEGYLHSYSDPKNWTP